MSGHLISTDLVPVGGFYLAFMGVLAAGLRLHRRGPVRRDTPALDRDPSRRDPAAPDQAAGGGRRPGPLAGRLSAGWPAFAAHVLATMLGGYLLLLAVLTGYSYGVSKVGGDFLASAWTGCAMLAGLALPVFAAASWLASRRPGRPATPAAPPPAVPPPAGPQSPGPEPVPD